MTLTQTHAEVITHMDSAERKFFRDVVGGQKKKYDESNPAFAAKLDRLWVILKPENGLMHELPEFLSEAGEELYELVRCMIVFVRFFSDVRNRTNAMAGSWGKGTQMSWYFHNVTAGKADVTKCFRRNATRGSALDRYRILETWMHERGLTAVA